MENLETARPAEVTDMADPTAINEAPRGNELDLTSRSLGPALFEGCGYHRIDKRQIFCRKCRREVVMTQQTGLNAGRRIIVCQFHCHGDKGVIKICQDQLSPDMIFEVFEGEPSLREPKNKPLALPERKASGPVDIDVEVEVTPGYTPAENLEDTPIRRLRE